MNFNTRNGFLTCLRQLLTCHYSQSTKKCGEGIWNILARQAVCNTRVQSQYSYSINRYFHQQCINHAKRTQDFSTAATPAKVEENPSSETDVVEAINTKVKTEDVGRLFAVVHVGGKQFKVTTEDIIIVPGDFHPTIGDCIKLEKVLLVGGKDFSMIGRPLLRRDLVNVEALVVEKTLSAYRIAFMFQKRKNFRRLKIKRNIQTMLLIKSIELTNLQ